MSDDAWFDSYLAGNLHQPLTGAGTAVTAVPCATTAVTAVVGQSPTVGEADPLLVVGHTLERLAVRGVPVVVDHSLECAVEAAGRLLRCLGVETLEALDSWTVTPWTT
ncbi:MAG TPA: hypothetical protein VL738_25545 [Dactylosporangium sp.]|jgi:hypothetical protein|nr:hypothetical protein [Dactylosporangium sp.]